MSPHDAADSPSGETSRDRGRLLSQILCSLFAFVGAIPLALGVILQNRAALDWAARETESFLQTMLGLEASFDVGFQAIPLALTLQNVTVLGTDTSEPALRISDVRVSPRLLSLLAGRLDAGDIEIGPSNVRLIIKNGKIENVPLRLPASSGGPLKLEHAPFRSLSLESARVDLTIDDNQIQTDEVDLDVLASSGLTFDLALRLAGATVRSRTATPAGPRDATDRVCSLEFRARASPSALFIKRFSLESAVELESATGTRPLCGERNNEQALVRLSQVEATLKAGRLSSIHGNAMVRAPIELARRFVRLPDATGTVQVSVSAHYRPGMKLPELTGELSGSNANIGRYKVGDSFRAELQVAGEVIRIPRLEAVWGNGRSVLTGIELYPFQENKPFRLAEMQSRGVDFPGVMRDVGVAPHTIVDWHYDEVVVTQLRGTIAPFALDGGMSAQTSNFVVWNKGYDHPEKKRMIGVKAARLVGRFRANKDALEFYSVNTTFGSSRVPVELVSISFHGGGPIAIRLGSDPIIELADVGPIANLDVAGRAHVNVQMNGPMNHPSLDGTFSVENLKLDRYELGNLEESSVHFEPLSVSFKNAVLKKKHNRFRVPMGGLKFDGKAPLELHLKVDSDQLELSEFFEILHFDEDPRFADLNGNGKTSATIRYAIGGPEDVCDGGRLRIDGSLDLARLDYAGETFAPAQGEFRLDWFDMQAGTRGMRLSIPSARISKGSGSGYASAEITPDGFIRGSVITTRLPIGRVDALRPWLAEADGTLTAKATLGGRLDALSVEAHASVGEVRIDKRILPPSELDISLVPRELPLRASGLKTGCGRVITVPYTKADHDRDESDGEILVRGDLFSGQVHIDELSISRQRDRRMRATIKLDRLDVGALSALGAGSLGVNGHASGTLRLDNFRASSPFSSRASFDLSALHLERAGYVLETPGRGGQLGISDGTLKSRDFSLALRTPEGQAALFDLDLLLNEKLEIAAHVAMHETPLGALTSPFDAVQEADGVVSLGIDIEGTLSAPQYKGYVSVNHGKLLLKDLDAPITDLELRVEASARGLQVTEGRASLGGGSLTLTGSAPFTSGGLGRASLAITGRSLALPLQDGVRVKLDTDLELVVPPRSTESLPRLSGRLTIDSASYERMMSMTADLASLTARGKKSEVDAASPEDNQLEFDVVVLARRPIAVKNDLIQAELTIDPQGIHLTGTNQSFGAVGNLEVESGSKLFFRSSKFEVQRGSLRFNDPTNISPEVELHAVTDFRRSYAADSLGSTTRTSAGSGTGTFRIYLNASGPPHDLRVDLTSDPPLGQDDIFLLLTVGLTQAELARTQSAGVGSSVALEALGSLSGAESAVTSAVKVDEFRFGSTYSMRTGRTEPTVTIGKALSERVRASVTTAISDSNEVRSDLEYRANSRLSFQGSYDNSQRSGGPSVGNIGGDIRWRLEFD